MNEFLLNLEKSLEFDVPILTLIGTFTAIDVIAALDSEDGITSSSKFEDWLKKNLPQYIGKVTPKDYHNFRCGLLHQLTGGRKGDTFNSLVFYPKSSQIQAHLSIASTNNEKYFFVRLEDFVSDVMTAIKECIKKSSHYEKHKESVITLHPEGIPDLNWIGSINGKPPALIASLKRGSAAPKKFKKKK